MKNGKTEWSETFLYAATAYALIEWYVHKKKKKRHNEIKKELDTLTSTTIECLEQGFNQGEIFAILVNRIDKKNPLNQEITRVKVKIGVNTVRTDIDDILDEFENRIGMEEISNYCLALKQYEIAGKAVKMLRKQLDLIRSEENFRQKRETQYKANLNSVAVVIYVICTMIVLVVPMIVILMQNAIFK